MIANAQGVTTAGLEHSAVASEVLNRFRTAAIKTAQKTVGITNRHISASTVRRRLRERDIRSQHAYRGNVLTPIRRQTLL